MFSSMMRALTNWYLWVICVCAHARSWGVSSCSHDAGFVFRWLKKKWVFAVVVQCKMFCKPAVRRRLPLTMIFHVLFLNSFFFSFCGRKVSRDNMVMVFLCPRVPSIARGQYIV